MGTTLSRRWLQLAGGVGEPLRTVREDLINLLADVEAGLDFTDEDIQFVRQKEMLDRLARALALVTLIRRQIEQRDWTQTISCRAGRTAQYWQE